MASFEHKIIPVSLGWNGVTYSFNAEGDSIADDRIEQMGKEGWEFICFWDNPEPYIETSFESNNLPLIKLAVFKRQID